MSQQSAVMEETSKSDSAETEADTSAPAPISRKAALQSLFGRGRRVGDSAIRLKTLVAGVLVVGLVAAVSVLAWQVHSKSNEIDRLHSATTAQDHAEQVALDYATGAAEMDFHDLASWRGRLTKGTSPELSNRLTQAASSMEQIITPLQWTSTAKPIVAKVRSESNGIYSVACFVSVLTKNSQAPDGIQSTATYQLSVDSRHNWTITEIGGIDSALPGPMHSTDKAAPPAPSAPAPGNGTPTPPSDQTPPR